MLSGQVYNAADAVLVAERTEAHAVCRTFNLCACSGPAELKNLLSIFGNVGNGVFIESPFLCDYGYNISLGSNVYFNFNVTILDCALVTIGNNVKFGPGVQLYTAGHSLDPLRRAAGDEFALPILIGDGAWIGGGAIILPGVEIGRNVVVGAGAVVTKSIPPDEVVAGSPAKIIRASKKDRG